MIRRLSPSTQKWRRMIADGWAFERTLSPHLRRYLWGWYAVYGVSQTTSMTHTGDVP